MEWGVATTIFTGVSAALAAIAGAWVTVRGQRDTAETTGRADEWQKLFDTLEHVHEERAQALSDRLEETISQVQALRSDVDMLSVKLGDSLSLNRTLLGIVDGAHLVDIPASIAADLA